ncbi:MAG: HhH-GPD family protein [Candidatus Nanopelagicales bacterium]
MPDGSPIVTALQRWFKDNGRPLPWRDSDAWGVLVSEVMLQQTPVARVLPAWHAWMSRWPTPPDLARASVADALREWGRLGYPRRAARLHATAVVITHEHAGAVPDTEVALRSLPGVGEYTAAAVMAFAHGRRAVVLDTNVRRVLARTIEGAAQQSDHITNAERDRAASLWPAEDRASARWSAAVMEFGAVVCTARSPACGVCPIQGRCAWFAAGRPPAASGPQRQPAYAGSDREARGRILAAVRASTTGVPGTTLARAWPDHEQRQRALASLVADGLVTRLPGGRYALPG